MQAPRVDPQGLGDALHRPPLRRRAGLLFPNPLFFAVHTQQVTRHQPIPNGVCNHDTTRLSNPPSCHLSGTAAIVAVVLFFEVTTVPHPLEHIGEDL